MDPASAAGLGLSAVSLAFQLSAGCVTGFVLLSTAHNFGEHSQSLICMLHLEEARLVEWARRAGPLPLDKTTFERLNGRVIAKTLEQLQLLLLDVDNLKKRYRLDIKVSASTQDDTENFIAMSASLANGIVSQTISSDLRMEIMKKGKAVKSHSGWPRRMWWAAVDRDNLQRLIGDVHHLVQSLWYLLDSIRQDDTSVAMQNMLSHVIRISDRVEQLSSLPKAMQETPAHSTLGPEETAIVAAARIKAVRLQMHLENGVEPVQPNHAGLISIIGYSSYDQPLNTLKKSSIVAFTPLPGSSDMGPAKYEGRSVFVEWKQMPTQSREKFLTRAQNLARLLSLPKHDESNTLMCLGLGRDNDTSKVAFVYTLQEHRGPNNATKSLRNSFGTRPSVSDRLRLALSLVRTLKWLHTAG